ncbi:MAG TPA: adenosylcobinamide-GDP ribazoletransferase [Gaiellaceae bacterium]|nr:adenosylcobinamide-GDP ribazoletransferase [Gaiellaceae bacterium]
MIGIEQQGATPRRRAELRALAAAVCFLTRLPLGRWISVDGEDVMRAGAIFPLVGAGIGAAVGGAAFALAHLLSAWLAAVLALAVGVVLTGALHIDALADSADALGARSRERALEIMRDHAIGSYGAVAIALDLLLKVGALSALIAHGDVVRVAVSAGALSRAAAVLSAALLPYARADVGLGTPLTQAGSGRALLAFAVGAALAVGLAGWHGAILAATALALTLLGTAACRRRLGGVTGDTLGAALELIETAVLVTAAGLAGAR